MDKVLRLEKVAEIAGDHVRLMKRAGGVPCVVLAHGCFDLLHLGHVRHLTAARKLGSLLVVTVTPDHYVSKGPGRPLFSQEERAEMLAALECVDYVAVNEWPAAAETIRLLRPTIYAKGGEYKDVNKWTYALGQERTAAESCDGRLEFTDTELVHTTDLVERLRERTESVG